MNYYLGIDWGGTNLKAGLVDERGRLIRKEVVATRSLRDKKSFIQSVKNLRACFSGYKISAIGVGIPGPVDIKRGRLYCLPNVPGWKNYPLRAVLERTLKIPVFLENDANLFALAEARQGAGRGKARILFFTLGTGLGSSFICHGRILSGATGSWEMAHVPISLTGKRCGCGAVGCIETFVGANYLLAEYARLKKCPPPQEVNEIYLKACAGEKEARAVWDGFAEVLGKFFGGMINVFNPETLVLGGGVAGAFALFKPMLVKAIKKQAMAPKLKGLKIVRAALADSGVIGAAILARDKTARKGCDEKA